MNRQWKYHLNCFVRVRSLPAQHNLGSSGHFPFAHFAFNCGLFLARFNFLYSLPRSLSHLQNPQCFPFPWHLLHFQQIPNVAKTQWLSRNSRWPQGRTFKIFGGGGCFSTWDQLLCSYLINVRMCTSLHSFKFPNQHN